MKTIKWTLVSIVLFILVIILVVIPVYSSHVNSEFNETTAYKKCDWEYEAQVFNKELGKYETTCMIGIDDKFVLYDKTISRTSRCPWRYIFCIPLFGGCWRDSIDFDKESFDVESLIIRKGCDNQIYYIFTPKKGGEHQIISNGTCDYNTIFHIIVSD